MPAYLKKKKKRKSILSLHTLYLYRATSVKNKCRLFSKSTDTAKLMNTREKAGAKPQLESCPAILFPETDTSECKGLSGNTRHPRYLGRAPYRLILLLGAPFGARSLLWWGVGLDDLEIPSNPYSSMIL